MNKLIRALAATDIPKPIDAVRDDLADAAKEYFPVLYQLNRSLDSESEHSTRGLTLGLANAYYALTVEFEDDPFGAFNLEPPDIDFIQAIEKTFSGQQAQIEGMDARELVALVTGSYPALEAALDGEKTEAEEDFQSGVTVGLTAVALRAAMADADEPEDEEEDFADLGEPGIELVNAEEDYQDPATDGEGPQPPDEDLAAIESLSQLLGELQALNHGAMPSLAVSDDGLLRLSLAVVCDDHHNVDLMTLQRVRDLLMRCSPDSAREQVVIRAIESSIVVTATLPDFRPIK